MIESPYKGLASFGDSELDATLFFGREHETETIVVNVLANDLTVVYGPSGVGKSSLVRAGVAQRLRTQGAGVVVVHDSWSERPVDALVESVRLECPELGPTAGLADTVAAAAHRHGEVHLLLDQFEDYFLYHGLEGPLADELPALLRRPGLRVSVLVALRDDAVAQLDSFAGRLPEMLDNLLRLDRLDRRAAREAILRPLERYGELTGARYAAEPGLVEAVLDQTSEGRVDFSGAGEPPGASDRIEAPFLQLVLERLWTEERARGSDVLRLATFEALGGAEGIVREHVHGSLEQLPEPTRATAARVVRQLVTASGARISYAAADLAEYAAVEPAELRATLDTLLRDRIVRSVNGSEGTARRYEIFHDVLAAPVLAWRQAYELERERAAARRQRRRLLTLVGAAVAALLVVAAIAAYALSQRSSARAEARRAHGRELLARALADLPTDPAASVATALEGARLAQGPEAETVLRSTLLAMRERHVIRVGGRVVAAAFSPRGGAVLVASSNGRAGVYDLDGRRLASLPRRGELTRATWRPDGRVFATGDAAGTVTVWSAGGRELRRLRTPAPVVDLRYSRDLLVVGSGGYVRLVAPSGAVRRIHVHGAVVAADVTPDAGVLAVAFRRAGELRAELFDLRTRRVRATLPEKGIGSLAFAPGGRLLATGSTDRTARLWDVRTGRLRHVLRHRGHVLAERFSRDGASLLTASEDGAAGLWTVATGERQLLLTGATGAAEDAAFSPAGGEVAVAFADRTARLYDVRDGRVLAPLAGHTDAVTSVAFDPSGRVVATASDDGTARLWNSTAGDELVPVDRRPAPTAASFARGTTILTTSQRTARLVTVEGKLLRAIHTRAAIRGTAASRSSLALLEADGTVELVAGGGTRLLPARGVSAVANLPDGRLVLGFRDGSLRIGRRTARGSGSAVAAIAARAGRVAVLGADGRVRVYSDEGELLSRPRTRARAVALSSDGETLATAAGRDATLWNAGTGAREHTLRGHRSLVTDVEFSPDGGLLVTASADHDARLWDVHSGRLRHVLRGHFFAVRSASFSPDGRWVVTASQFTAGLWDVASGRLVSYLRGHVKPLTTASFGPGGWIATASEDGTARAVRCDICRSLPGLEEVARARLAAVRR